jgi:hypothetical protein
LTAGAAGVAVGVGQQEGALSLPRIAVDLLAIALRISSRLARPQTSVSRVSISQRELAEIAGLSREMINKQLRAREAHGCLECGARTSSSSSLTSLRTPRRRHRPLTQRRDGRLQRDAKVRSFVALTGEGSSHVDKPLDHPSRNRLGAFFRVR